MDEIEQGGDNQPYPLYWEPTYEIVLALMDTYPDADIESVGMKQLMDLILALPNFADEPAMATDQLLRDILREWYEEATV